VGERSVLFDEGDARLVTPVYQRDDLPPGATFDGPAIIDQLDSTTVVPPGTRATVDEWLNIRIDILEN
ncbi:MAG: N-methylhydantoinase, partial [Solirubrobacteraceae bacterium]|nr:N-methylhydantoinase [Solirubrobacteraceae bacterium]